MESSKSIASIIEAIEQKKQADTTPTKKIFLVGGTGMLGKSIIQHLVDKGYYVTSINLPSANEEDYIIHNNVEYISKDVNSLGDTELLRIMKGHNYMVVALGADERYTPKAPAIDFYRKYNVTYVSNLLRLARLAKIKKNVILGSYYTYFNKLWPELKLKEKHPYIRSRVEQMEQAFTFNSSVMEVVILELPYVFGTLPKYTPLWNILKDQLNSTKHIYYPLGGTAMATDKEVAGAVEGALLYGDGGNAYPICSINLKWKNFLSYLLELSGQSKKKLTPYSNLTTKREMKRKMKKIKKEDRESGLDLLEYLEFQNRDAFINPETCIKALKYQPDNLNEAITKMLKTLETNK